MTKSERMKLYDLIEEVWAKDLSKTVPNTEKQRRAVLKMYLVGLIADRFGKEKAVW